MTIGAMKKMKTSGKTTNITFEQLYNIQLANQFRLIQKGAYERFKDKDTECMPVDDVNLASYHIQQLVSEIGEILGADKRWKSHRNDKYDKQEKLEEIADCFIVLMNVAMFSGFNGDVVVNAIKEKLDIVTDRINNI